MSTTTMMPLSQIGQLYPNTQSDMLAAAILPTPDDNGLITNYVHLRLLVEGQAPFDFDATTTVTEAQAAGGDITDLTEKYRIDELVSIDQLLIQCMMDLVLMVREKTADLSDQLTDLARLLPHKQPGARAIFTTIRLVELGVTVPFENMMLVGASL